MEERYYDTFAVAYYRGLAQHEEKIALSERLLRTPLEELTDEENQAIITAGCAVRDRRYYFKRTHGEMPRVKRVLGFLRSVQFESLLDVGSGRGVFLIPLMDEFPWVHVCSADVLAHRIQFMQDMSAGGIDRLTAVNADITQMPFDEKSYDVVTLLEVLEHIPQVDRAVEVAVRIARKHIVVTVPSKPDDNPEHIHLLTKAALTDLFARAGCTRLRFDGVNGHLFMVATVGK